MKRFTRILAGLTAAGLALSTLLSVTAANTAVIACTAAVDNIKTDAVSHLQDIQRSDEQMQGNGRQPGDFGSGCMPAIVPYIHSSTAPYA